jgi:hypothetical protein
VHRAEPLSLFSKQRVFFGTDMWRGSMLVEEFSPTLQPRAGYSEAGSFFDKATAGMKHRANAETQRFSNR